MILSLFFGNSGELHVVHIQGLSQDNVIALVVGRLTESIGTSLRLVLKDCFDPNCAEAGRIDRIANLHT